MSKYVATLYKQNKEIRKVSSDSDKIDSFIELFKKCGHLNGEKVEDDVIAHNSDDYHLENDFKISVTTKDPSKAIDWEKRFKSVKNFIERKRFIYETSDYTQFDFSEKITMCDIALDYIKKIGK